MVRVVDGDTVDIRHDDRGRLRIRILGINAPRPISEAGRSAATAQKPPHGQVRFSQWDSVFRWFTDPTQGSTDRYGGSLAYLDLPDGRDFSVESVRAGMSQVATYGRRPVQRFADLTAAENEAKTPSRRPLGAALRWRDRISSRVGRAPATGDRLGRSAMPAGRVERVM